MLNRKWTPAIGASLLAIATMATPAMAQAQEPRTGQDDGISAGEAAAAAGAAVAAGVVMQQAGSTGLNATPKSRRASSLADLQRRGEMAQQARAGKIGSGADLADLERRGQAAQRARAGRIGNGANLDDLARRGDLARGSRARLRNAGNAAANSPSFERQLMQRTGPDDVSRLVRQGDAAQAARGRMVNEGQLVRNIGDKGGDISQLNKSGRAAQAARRIDTATDAARIVDRADDVADMAKVTRTARVTGKAGKAGRAALAGTGVGAAVVVAEVAGTEAVRALTGAELQDPLSTGIQYGAAIFDKDVTLADVAAQRWEHHKDNFAKVKETFTEPGRLGENLSAYGQEKAEQFEKAAKFIDEKDRAARSAIREETGIQFDRRSDTTRRYAEALSGGNALHDVGSVLADRTRHHIDNARAAGQYAQKIGAANREAIGNATGAKLDSVGDTASRYGKALSGDNKVKAVAEVAADRARHHADNARKVGSKISCGIGNIFRKKENDKDC